MWLALALLHLGLVGGLVLGPQQLPPRHLAGNAVTGFRAISVSLPPIPPAADPAPRRAPPARPLVPLPRPETEPEQVPTLRPSRMADPATARPPPQAITTLRPEEPSPGATVLAPPARADGPAAPDVPPTPPLDLRLPAPSRPGSPSAWRTPAQQAVEARVGGARKGSPEERMGRRLESEWTEERLPDGRVRMRRGDDCVLLSEARAAQIDPWNNRGTLPRGATGCPPP